MSALPAGSAQILPFPNRMEPQARLSRALAAMSAALDEQRIAMAAWRKATDELRDGVRQLDGSLRRFQGRLHEVRGGVAGLHAEATRLERWADGVLTPTR